MSPAFFFDRDGVVNVSPGAGYVLRWEDFHFSPGIVPALVRLKAAGFKLIVVTSQQGVGKGLMTQADLDEIHECMQRALAGHGAEFDAIYSCTCLASDPDCTCRKPAAEMIVKAAADHDLDLSASWLIGDHDRDIQMAVNAGVPKTIRVLGEKDASVAATHTLPSVSQLPTLLSTLLLPASPAPQ
ncbi:MAG: D-glycero-alpha-D-manno-heptose-1,7-bisphosphate 7-phosphatase [Verrucomicrobium sp.]|nr:HAD family hydrolase [Verrucomicrobium sp.]